MGNPSTLYFPAVQVTSLPHRGLWAMMYLEISSKLRRVRLDEGGFLCGEAFTRDSEDFKLSGGTKMMLDARELPDGAGEAVPEIDTAPEVAIKPSGT
jgi:hypothetical protein